MTLCPIPCFYDLCLFCFLLIKHSSATASVFSWEEFLIVRTEMVHTKDEKRGGWEVLLSATRTKQQQRFKNYRRGG